MRVCVAGGGLAGSLLAWRLAQRAGTEVDLMTGLPSVTDATTASGGAVRAYEPLPVLRELAIASLAELLASRVLRQWAGYRETGFAYLRETRAGLPAELAEIERGLPGSAELISPAEVFRPAGGGPGWTGDGSGVVVRERLAGYISPARLRGRAGGGPAGARARGGPGRGAWGGVAPLGGAGARSGGGGRRPASAAPRRYWPCARSKG